LEYCLKVFLHRTVFSQPVGFHCPQLVCSKTCSCYYCCRYCVYGNWPTFSGVRLFADFYA